MTDADFEAIKPWLLLTDVAMLAYWGATASAALGLVDLPSEWLYADHEDPMIVAWNWSFFPLDLALSISGLSAAGLFARSHTGWRFFLPISLILTWCAGAMALSFWAIRADFDPLWWGGNLFLVIWPVAFVPRLWRAHTHPTVPGGIVPGP